MIVPSSVRSEFKVYEIRTTTIAIVRIVVVDIARRVDIPNIVPIRTSSIYESKARQFKDLFGLVDFF
jgi:hypothetical protein